MKKTNAGFSLVELMVVVAIIGILATVAIPNFSRFQNKARQSNAKSELGGIATGEKVFYGEYGVYTSNLRAIGFNVDGTVPSTVAATLGCPNSYVGTVNRLYSVGFRLDEYTGVLPAMPIPANLCGLNLAGVPGTPVLGAVYNNYFPAAVAGVATALPAAVTAHSILGNNNPGAAFVNGSFTAVAMGRLPASSLDDVWSINQANAMLNTQNGN